MTGRGTWLVLAAAGLGVFALTRKTKADNDRAALRAELEELQELWEREEAQLQRDYVEQQRRSDQSEALINDLPEEIDEDDMLDLQWLGHIGP